MFNSCIDCACQSVNRVNGIGQKIEFFISTSGRIELCVTHSIPRVYQLWIWSLKITFGQDYFTKVKNNFDNRYLHRIIFSVNCLNLQIFGPNATKEITWRRLTTTAENAYTPARCRLEPKLGKSVNFGRIIKA